MGSGNLEVPKLPGTWRGDNGDYLSLGDINTGPGPPGLGLAMRLPSSFIETTVENLL
jgi:hypothetical protein